MGRSHPTFSRFSTPVTPPQARAEKFYRLGIKALQRGAVGVARLHFRMAVKHGSKRAASKLADLDGKPSANRTASRE